MIRPVLVFLAAALASAQPSNVHKAVRVIVPPQRIGIMTQAEITLDDVVQSVLANNRDIEASRISRAVASIRITGAKGAFDPLMSMNPGFVHTVSPVSSALGGGSIPGELRQTNITAMPQITGSSPWFGSTYGVSYQSARNSTDLTFATLNPQFPTTLTFSATQPLFRGLRIDDNRRQIVIAKKNLAISDEQFRQKVIETTTSAVSAYWDLVYAYRNLQIQVEAVDLARKQVESNQRQMEQGILAPIDVVEAENQLDTFEQNIYTAQQALTHAENVLKNLMLLNTQAALWRAALIPVTPLVLDPPAVEFPAAVEEAMSARPELKQVALSADVNQVSSRYFRDQTKPQADLVVSYSSSGLAGKTIGGVNPLTAGTVALTNQVNTLSEMLGVTPLPATVVASVPGSLIGGYAASLSNLTAFNYPGANASLRLSLPIRNRVAEANLAASVADGRRIENQRQQLQMQIQSDVSDTMQAMQSTKARLEAAVLARQSSEEQYQSEQRKFSEGTSTVFLVVQRQTAMITARNAELRAQTDVSKAIADFERATTRTLAVRKISIP